MLDTYEPERASLHTAVSEPGWHLLLCGPTSAWPTADITWIAQAYPDLVATHYLSRTVAPGALQDANGRAPGRLGLSATATAVYLIRPDGHIGYRCG